MNCELLGLHYRTNQPIRITSENGVITNVEPMGTKVAAADSLPWIAPSLFDLQINGFGGIDFQRDDLSLDDLLVATRALRRHGCARYFFTLITAEWPALVARLRCARGLRARSPELAAAIAGWHIEGPFLSPEPGFCGAHDPAAMLDPLPEHILQLRELTDPDPVLLTLAPERAGAIEAIQLAVLLGMRVSLGHTNATADQLRAAVAAGATGFTHLANACPRELDRHDNIIWRVAEIPELTASLIPDGIHVSAAPFRILHRLIPKVYYTTDAMAAAGASPGRYPLGRLELEVGPDQIVRQPGKTNFAGSALTPGQGVIRAARMLGVPWQETWQRASEVPAQLAGIRHGLTSGSSATFCTVTYASHSAELQINAPPF